jgi:hypothetical protein
MRGFPASPEPGPLHHDFTDDGCEIIDVDFVDALPKTLSGKIMRRILKARSQGLPEEDLSTLEQ